MLSFTIRAPELGEPIVLRGVVRWVVDAEQARAGRTPGMGVAFVYDSPEHRAGLEARLDRLMVQSLGAAAFERLMGKPAPPGPRSAYHPRLRAAGALRHGLRSVAFA